MVAVFEHWQRVPVEWKGGAVALGNFDGVHKGHQALLANAATQAKALGAPLMALTFEPQAHFNRAVETKRLSEREFNVILYVAAGYPNKRIARELDIAEATVKVHVNITEGNRSRIQVFQGDRKSVV